MQARIWPEIPFQSAITMFKRWCLCELGRDLIRKTVGVQKKRKATASRNRSRPELSQIDPQGGAIAA
ncbi:hypothetical protein HHK36_032366 [Tetracentron sinense]|uniref:Uncharacterized protein n=1 Tax=Tetracentron sinense TaxID=13715 RepID=A0A834Y886_TETSI|nr:hypothetical protein HHK36_032366 [Tetracentron sinense]